MSTRKWKYYQEPSLSGIYLGYMASGEYDTNLVRSTCANYAQTRRNVINLAYNIDVDQIALPGPETPDWFNWVNLRIGGRIIRPGKLYIYLLTSSTSELAANVIHCEASVGQDAVEATVEGTALSWRKLTLDLSHLSEPIPGERLKIRIKTLGTNDINIHAVSCYQPGVSGAPEFVDLDDANCVLGDADYPDSVFAMKLLRDNCVSVRSYKVPKANVWNQWFRDFYKFNTVYGTNNNDLGDYRFVKRAGVSEIKCHFLADEDNGTGAQVRMEILDPDAELSNAILPAAAQTANVTGVGSLVWYTLTWTFQGDDITEERNLELIIDGRDTAGLAAVMVAGVYLVETEPSAAIAHTIPDVVNTPIHSDILASTHDNIRTTSNHLYYRQGRQILIADWRFAVYSGGKYITQFLCQNDWAPGGAGDPAVSNNSCVARGLLYSSYGSTKLRSYLEYSTDDVADKTKQIQVSLSETNKRLISEYYEADPMYDLATNNIHDVYGIVDGDQMRKKEMCELEIRSADWEEHYDGANEPPQVYVNCRSDAGGVTGYIIPHQYSCEEIDIGEDEFP